MQTRADAEKDLTLLGLDGNSINQSDAFRSHPGYSTCKKLAGSEARVLTSNVDIAAYADAGNVPPYEPHGKISIRSPPFSILFLDAHKKHFRL